MKQSSVVWKVRHHAEDRYHMNHLKVAAAKKDAYSHCDSNAIPELVDTHSLDDGAPLVSLFPSDTARLEHLLRMQEFAALCRNGPPSSGVEGPQGSNAVAQESGDDDNGAPSHHDPVGGGPTVLPKRRECLLCPYTLKAKVSETKVPYSP